MIYTVLTFLFLLMAGSVPVTPNSTGLQAHEGQDCSACHAFVADATQEGMGGGIPDSRCRSCHVLQEPSNSSTVPQFHGRSDKRCAACHSYHSPASIQVGKASFSFDFDNKSAKYQCIACHAPGSDLTKLSIGHRQAADYYHSNLARRRQISPSQTCLACHSSGSSTGNLPEGAGYLPRVMQSASHPIGVKVVPGSGYTRNQIRYYLDPRLPLDDGLMECQTCHQLTSPDENLLIVFDSPYELCRGCHQHNP
ncbi:MAG: hypothetical protein KAU36_07795 [candidate division Zixibacteria bacterium]|nr:hypothetical protein [candidate division Zixibacteria bacterium]